jgi:thioredoxin 1
MAAIDINNTSFQEMINQDKPLLVDFWAPWCPYCRRIATAYDKVAEQNEGGLLVAKVNTDNETELAEAEKIEVLPTLVLYQGGKALGSIVAPESKAMIDTFIKETLAKQ